MRAFHATTLLLVVVVLASPSAAAFRMHADPDDTDPQRTRERLARLLNENPSSPSGGSALTFAQCKALPVIYAPPSFDAATVAPSSGGVHGQQLRGTAKKPWALMAPCLALRPSAILSTQMPSCLRQPTMPSVAPSPTTWISTNLAVIGIKFCPASPTWRLRACGLAAAASLPACQPCVFIYLVAMPASGLQLLLLL